MLIFCHTRQDSKTGCPEYDWRSQNMIMTWWVWPKMYLLQAVPLIWNAIHFLFPKWARCRDGSESCFSFSLVVKNHLWWNQTDGSAPERSCWDWDRSWTKFVFSQFVCLKSFCQEMRDRSNQLFQWLWGQRLCSCSLLLLESMNSGPAAVPVWEWLNLHDTDRRSDSSVCRLFSKQTVLDGIQTKKHTKKKTEIKEWYKHE